MGHSRWTIGDIGIVLTLGRVAQAFDFARHHRIGGAPSFACFSRRVGDGGIESRNCAPSGRALFKRKNVASIVPTLAKNARMGHLRSYDLPAKPKPEGVRRPPTTVHPIVQTSQLQHGVYCCVVRATAGRVGVRVVAGGCSRDPGRGGTQAEDGPAGCRACTASSVIQITSCRGAVHRLEQVCGVKVRQAVGVPRLGYTFPFGLPIAYDLGL